MWDNCALTFWLKWGIFPKTNQISFPLLWFMVPQANSVKLLPSPNLRQSSQMNDVRFAYSHGRADILWFGHSNTRCMCVTCLRTLFCTICPCSATVSPRRGTQNLSWSTFSRSVNVAKCHFWLLADYVSCTSSLFSFALSFVPWYAAHNVEFSIGPHVSEVGHPVGHGKERGDGTNVPGILAVEAHFLQGLEVLLSDGVAATHSQGKVQHGALPRRQLCILIVHNDLGESGQGEN